WVDVQLGPMATGAWVGLLVTFINLIPIGQLDGGHVAAALFGDRHERMARWLHRGLAVVGGVVATMLASEGGAAGRSVGAAGGGGGGGGGGCGGGCGWCGSGSWEGSRGADITRRSGMTSCRRDGGRCAWRSRSRSCCCSRRCRCGRRCEVKAQCEKCKEI